MTDFATERTRMVDQQLRNRDIEHTAVLDAMETVPRDVFVPEEYKQFAYTDSPLPIPADQTISQPYVVAYMIAQLDPKPEDRVLEIGGGSGYAAAVLSRIVKAVYTVERHATLVEYARERLAQLGYDNVHVRHGDGTQGWPEHAPYDGIIVAAGGPTVPVPLQEQLAVNGRLVIPVGRARRQQRLVLVTRTGADAFQRDVLSPVAFVPLIGEEGWEG